MAGPGVLFGIGKYRSYPARLLFDHLLAATFQRFIASVFVAR
jgi:hypothetical protein